MYQYKPVHAEWISMELAYCVPSEDCLRPRFSQFFVISVNLQNLLPKHVPIFKWFVLLQLHLNWLSQIINTTIKSSYPVGKLQSCFVDHPEGRVERHVESSVHVDRVHAHVQRHLGRTVVWVERPDSQFWRNWYYLFFARPIFLQVVVKLMRLSIIFWPNRNFHWLPWGT